MQPLWRIINIFGLALQLYAKLSTDKLHTFGLCCAATACPSACPSISSHCLPFQLPHGEVPHPSEVHSSTDWQYSSRRRHHKPTRRLPTSSTRNRLAWEGPSPDQDLLLHVGTEVACRDLAPSLPSMKTDTLGKQDRCCGCWCPPSILAVLFTPAELFLLEAVETEPASSQIRSDGKSPTACTCTTGD